MSKTLTKVERKEIVKLLQSLGLRTSRKNSTIEEVKFARFERVSHVKQDGYKWDRDKSSNQLWLDFRSHDKMVEMANKITELLTENNYVVQNFQDVLIINRKADKKATGGGVEIVKKTPKIKMWVNYLNRETLPCLFNPNKFQDEFMYSLSNIVHYLRKIDTKFSIDSNPNNFAYNIDEDGDKVICLFDIEDVQDGGNQFEYVKENYKNQEFFENPQEDDNYELIGQGQASMGAVYLDKRDDTILKLTASSYEVYGTSKVQEAQEENEIDSPYNAFFPTIFSIQNAGEIVMNDSKIDSRGQARTFYAIRRTSIEPFEDTRSLKEIIGKVEEENVYRIRCLLTAIKSYYNIVENKSGYEGTILIQEDINKPINLLKEIMKSPNQYLAKGGKIKKGNYIVHVSDNKSLTKTSEEPMHFGTLEQSYNRSDALNYGNDARYYKTKVKKDWKIYDATDKEANILAKDLPTGFDYDAIRYENEVEGEGTSYIVLTEEIDIEPLEQDDFYALGGGVDVPKGKISPKELRKELERLESLYSEDLTPIQIQYLGKAVFKIKELTREFKHDISRDERIKTTDKANEVGNKLKALAMLDKNYLKSLKGKLNEDYAYHFTDKYGLGEIVENPQIAPQLSLTTFPYFAEPSLGTVKNYRGTGVNKNTQFFSDLDVKIVFDLQKLRKEQTLKNGSRTQQTHFGEYELIWVDDKKKPANILDFILWIELKKKNKKSVLDYEIDDWEGEETTIGEVLKENGIETKEWKPVDVEAYLFKGKKPKYALGGGVEDDFARIIGVEDHQYCNANDEWKTTKYYRIQTKDKNIGTSGNGTFSVEGKVKATLVVKALNLGASFLQVFSRKDSVKKLKQIIKTQEEKQIPKKAKGGGVISDKVKFLIKEEGYPKDQATAIAYSMQKRGELALGGEVTESNNFKKWFGKSKMVDADGKPIVVYHGSVVDFNKFDKKKLGRATKTSIAKLGFYFTADYNSAKQYVLFSGMMQSGTLTEPKSYYLSLQNPYYMEIAEWDEYINWGSLETQKYKTKGKAQKASLELKAKLIENGHDSIVIGNNIEIIAFEPNQIKLADGSNTTFDENNPDIRFNDGGKVDAPKGDCYVVAGQVAMGITPKEIDFVGTPYVVHGEVTGQGAIEGLKYGHAWIEDDVNVYDWSNGRELDFPKEIYYLLGGIEDKKGKLFKYTFDEARRKMLDTGHYGSWDLKTKF